jgi:hypothetical protein
MNTIYFLLSLICTRQIFHYIQNEKCNDCGQLFVQEKELTNIPQQHYGIKQFLKLPPRPQYIKNMKIDNGKFLFMLLTVFI